MKTVTIVIEPNGEFSIDLVGFHGKGCDQAMKDFSGNAKPKREVLKPEYREQTQDQKERQRG